jgi:hypothetical protein
MRNATAPTFVAAGLDERHAGEGKEEAEPDAAPLFPSRMLPWIVGARGTSS